MLQPARPVPRQRPYSTITACPSSLHKPGRRATPLDDGAASDAPVILATSRRAGYNFFCSSRGRNRWPRVVPPGRGPLAQLAEQQTLNLRVVGSIPTAAHHFPYDLARLRCRSARPDTPSDTLTVGRGRTAISVGSRTHDLRIGYMLVGALDRGPSHRVRGRRSARHRRRPCRLRRRAGDVVPVGPLSGGPSNYPLPAPRRRLEAHHATETFRVLVQYRHHHLQNRWQRLPRRRPWDRARSML